MARKLVLSLVLFCVLLCLLPGTCSAATVEAQEQEIRQLLQNSMRSGEIISILQMNSSEAQQSLLKTTEELRALKKELAELKQAHQQLMDSYAKMTALSQRQSSSIKTINESFEKYSHDMKTKVKSLELQRNAALIALIAAAII